MRRPLPRFVLPLYGKKNLKSPSHRFFHFSSSDDEDQDQSFTPGGSTLSTSATDSEIMNKLKQRNLTPILHSDAEDEKLPIVRPMTTSSSLSAQANGLGRPQEASSFFILRIITRMSEAIVRRTS